MPSALSSVENFLQTLKMLVFDNCPSVYSIVIRLCRSQIYSVFVCYSA